MMLELTSVQTKIFTPKHGKV
uniref:Uncharacterized protein n=1 Tax=Arundo donax TaxID=35708 RepID=A0A0A9AHR9_ARUDO